MSKTVLVTGHASGIGSFVAKACHLIGYRVIGIDLMSDETLDKSIHQICCDLTDEQRVLDAFEGIQHLDYAMNCAGIPGVRKPVSDISTNEFLSSWRDIFLPTFHAMREEIRIMRGMTSRCKIINIASSTAGMGSKGMVAYSAAKAGIVNLTKVAAIEEAPHILINSISPATIDTPMTRRKYQGELPDYRDTYLTGHCGTPADVFSGIQMLMDNDFMTGQDIVMDGGYGCAFVVKR